MWRYDLAGQFSAVQDLALDAAGDVYVTGTNGEFINFLAAKITGGTGTELWRHEIGGNDVGVGLAVAVDPVGAPVFAGEVDLDFALLGFEPMSGAPLWSYTLTGDPDNAGSARDVALDEGYAFAAGVSVFPPIPNNANATRALTLVRIPDPASPPIVGNCAPAPRNDCRLPTAPAQAQLFLKDRPGSRSDRLQWKWTKGEATTPADLGDALNAATTYSLCLYEGSATRVFSAAVAGGGLCGTRPCWKSLRGGAGFAYKPKDREPEGLHAIVMKSGDAGKATVVVKRKGRANLDLPLPPLASLALPVTVQFQRDGGPCFGATFSAAGVIVHDGIKLKARSD
jgi:hypothetical protein